MIRLVRASLLLALLSLLAAETDAQCPAARNPRGRAKIVNGTVVSDNGTPLRGLRYSLDIHNRVPAKSQIKQLACHGMNVLHVYAEKYDTKLLAGYNELALMKLVQATQDNGMYLVVTIGGTPNPTFALEFWTYYAPRLIQYPHVIFELQNEPWFTNDNGTWRAQPLPEEWIAFEADAYNIIRSHEPDYGPKSIVLLFTYAFFRDPIYVIKDIGRLQSTTMIDWSHTAIAFHGYAGQEATREAIQSLRAWRPDIGVMETELACFVADPSRGCSGLKRPSDSLYHPLLDLYERQLPPVSWLSFLDLSPDANGEPTLNEHWDGPLMKFGISWMPDMGPFPSPYTVQGPSPVTIQPGQTVDLRVTISGLGNRTLCYQWYRNGDLMPGERTPLLRVAPLETTLYRVDVSDDCNTTSHKVTVTVP